jgi:hypothetical protein
VGAPDSEHINLAHVRPPKRPPGEGILFRLGQMRIDLPRDAVPDHCLDYASENENAQVQKKLHKATRLAIVA